MIRVRHQLRRSRDGDRLAPLKTSAASRDVAIGGKLAGLDVVNVSKQLGDASPAITLAVYADEFDRAGNQDQVRAALDAARLETCWKRPAASGRKHGT